MARKVKGHGFERLTPVDAARDRFLRLVRAGPLGREQVATDDALGRRLAAPFKSAGHLPPFDRSAMDGFAVRARDTFGATVTNPLPLRLVGEAKAGRAAGRRVGKGECVAIATGGAVPEGADAVIMVERTRALDDGTVEVEEALTPGENVSLRGEDVRPGERFLAAGSEVTPADIGLAAALGVGRLTVARRPRVGVLSTGDELARAGRRPGPGQVVDANRPAAIAALRQAGGEPVDLGIVPDDLARIRGALGKALGRLDLVVVSGGTSVGVADHVPEAIGALGKPGIVVHGVGMRPGYPVALGAARKKPFVLLPGSPVAAALCVQAFAVPAVRKMLGAPLAGEPAGARVEAVARRRIPGAAGLQTYARVLLTESGGTLVADPVRISGAGVLSSLVRANGLVVLPPKKEGIEEGERVEVVLLREVARRP